MFKSEEFLKKAFAGESQANRKYIAFAEVADKEGYHQVAKLFRAAAEAETIHALNHLKALRAVSDTRQNLKEAIEGETHEFTQMYPEMIKTAQDECNQDAQVSFYRANEVEKVHAEMYEGLLERLDEKVEPYPYYVCPVCGYTVGWDAPNSCPVCATQKKLFKKIE
jgi:rubrerythrin